MATPLAILLAAAIVTALGARHLQRAFFYPLPRAMPEVVEEDVETALRRLQAALAAHAPAVLSALQPGLTDDEVAALEAEHRVRLTDDLRALYRWRNGSPDSTAGLVPSHWFVPLGLALENRAGHRRQVSDASLIQRVAHFLFAGHVTNWLVVLDDLCGDGYFYDPARRRRGGSFFYHFAQMRHYAYFPSLSNFLAGAAECYETGVYRTDARGKVIEDLDRSPALWPRYASSAGG